MKGLAGGQAGFTLIEVVVVVAMIGILTAIAIPSYTAYIMRSNRSDARSQLLMASQWMERVRNESGSYATVERRPVRLAASPPTGPAKYNITLRCHISRCTTCLRQRPLERWRQTSARR